MLIVSPTYFATSYAGISGVAAGFRRATELPLFEPEPIVRPGILLEFDQPDQERSIDVPVPRLPGLDDLEVEQVRFDLSTAEREETAVTSGSAAGGSVTLGLSAAAAGAVVRLKRVEIEGLAVGASAGQSIILAGAITSGSLGQVAYIRDPGADETRIVANGNAPLADWAHFLLRPAAGSDLGPPVAAAPYFAMPGEGRAMYGPALGAASLVLTQVEGGSINAVLRFIPAQNGSRFALLLGRASQAGPNEGLPNEVTPLNWSAQSVRAVFDVRPAAVTIEASTDSLADERPLVAQFPSDPGDLPVEVDFAPVARSLLRRSYPLATGDDLGLKLWVTAKSPGIVRVNLGSTRARYLHRPLEQGPAQVTLRGSPEDVELVVPVGLRPSALSFVLDGNFGPARLTLDSDTETPDPRHGLRVAGPIQIARRLELTAVETALPLARLSIFGRASEECEVLLSLHGGDTTRVGSRLSETVSLSIAGNSGSAWHRLDLPVPGLLPPHPKSLWLVARTTQGVFWWHGSLEGEGVTQRSTDDGERFGMVAGRPLVHVAVNEVDSATGFPAPRFPLSLLLERDTMLNADLVGGNDQIEVAPPDFRRFWIAEGEEHADFLARVATLQGRLRLTLSCQRDVDLTLSDVVLTYDPWRANPEVA